VISPRTTVDTYINEMHGSRGKTVDGIAISVILVNYFGKFNLIIQDAVKRLAVERKVLRTVFEGIKVNGNS
jgi:hypothetical protein